MIGKDRKFATCTYPNAFWQMLVAGITNLSWEEVQSLCKKFNLPENDFWEMAKEMKDNFLPKTESNLHPVFQDIVNAFNNPPVIEDDGCKEPNHE